MLDFTLKKYKKLLNTLINQGFSFLPFEEFILNPAERVIVLRHDVDALPQNSLQFARIQSDKGIRGTYYFRIVPGSFDEKTIKEINSLGHEIGYHYEDLSLVADRLLASSVRCQENRKGYMTQDAGLTKEELIKIAIESFRMNLEKLREIVPVNTICMHGSPMNNLDNKLLWKYYDYHNFGIVGEPYFDIDYERVLYLTDTGRSWNGEKVNIRDKRSGIRDWGLGEESYNDWKVKPVPGSLMNITSPAIDYQQKYKFRSTLEIIKAAERGELPDRIMMTIHPQRWTDKPGPWVKELVWQNVKNVGKWLLVKSRD